MVFNTKQTCVILLVNYFYVSSSVRFSASDQLLRVIDALKLSLQFYADEYAHMNLDGIFGLRILEGQLSVIIDQLTELGSPAEHVPAVNKWKSDEDGLLSTLKLMRMKASYIGDHAETTLQSIDKRYYSLLQPLVHRPWLFFKPYGKFLVNHELKWSPPASRNGSDMLSEEESDKCMAELLGTGVEKSFCSITSKCISVMTMPRCSGYHLTHQILYGMVSEQYGCLTQLNGRLGHARTSIEQLRSQQCANNFYEASQDLIEQNGQVPNELQDLFMEQEFICPSAGYVEFLHSDWLEQILSWQKPSGCWGTPAKSSVGSSKNQDSNQLNMKITPDFVDDKNVRPLDSVHGNSFEHTTSFRKRLLLYEKSITGGCLSHKTAVALGALTQYLRFLLLASDMDVSEYLNGVNYLLNPSYLRYRSTSKMPSEQHENVNGELKNEVNDVSYNRFDSSVEDKRIQELQRLGGLVDANNLEINIQEGMNDDLPSIQWSTVLVSQGYNEAGNGHWSEPSAKVQYQSDKILSLGSLTLSLWYIYFGVLLISGFAIWFSYRLLRCQSRFRCWLI